MDTWTHLDRWMKIKKWMSSDASFAHMTWKNLSASLSIERMQLSDDDLWRDIQSEPLIENEEAHPRDALKFPYKLTFSLMKNFVLGCFEQIELLRQLIPRITWFLLLLDSFPHPGIIWNQYFVESIVRNHLLNAELWVWLREFFLIFVLVALDFNVEWQINRIIDNFKFSLSLWTNFFFDFTPWFSANTDTNSVMFDS